MKESPRYPHAPVYRSEHQLTFHEDEQAYLANTTISTAKSLLLQYPPTILGRRVDNTPLTPLKWQHPSSKPTLSLQSTLPRKGRFTSILTTPDTQLTHEGIDIFESSDSLWHISGDARSSSGTLNNASVIDGLQQLLPNNPRINTLAAKIQRKNPISDYLFDTEIWNAARNYPTSQWQESSTYHGSLHASSEYNFDTIRGSLIDLNDQHSLGATLSVVDTLRKRLYLLRLGATVSVLPDRPTANNLYSLDSHTGASIYKEYTFAIETSKQDIVRQSMASFALESRTVAADRVSKMAQSEMTELHGDDIAISAIFNSAITTVTLANTHE